MGRNFVSDRPKIDPAGKKEEPKAAPMSEKTIEQHFEDLAKYREEHGMPVAGSSEDNVKGSARTVAKLVVGDKEFIGTNAHGRKPITLKVNSISITHAETDVFQQAKDAGISGGKAVLIVDREVCPPCGLRGAVKSMAKQLGLTEVEIHSRGKPTLKFNPFESGNPFKNYYD